MAKTNLRVLFTAYECAPFFKFGGLGDVVGSLPKALKELGIDVRVIMPYYKVVKEKFPEIKQWQTGIKVKTGKQKMKFNIYKTVLPGSKVPIYFIDNKKWFQVKDIFDKKAKERFLVFSCLVAQMSEVLGWKPDIVHANDWQTGLLTKIQNTINKTQGFVKIIYTIHNLAYAGRTEMKVLEKYGFEKNDFSRVDKKGKVNIMREAILGADIVNTVSPTYAGEILTKEFGAGMEDSLLKREKDLYGIVNGLDYNIFNPGKDENIKFKYGIENLENKRKNKLYLQRIAKLPEREDVPIIGMVSRLAGQKGFDLLEQIFDELMEQNLQLVLLGSGDKYYHDFFVKMGKKYKDKFSPNLVFDIKLASQIYAGADMFLMPSKYEPCGLGQLIAMKYGTVPIVRATGGLEDTVSDKTGFKFDKYDSGELLSIVRQAIIVYNKYSDWNKLVQNCMKQDFSWGVSAKEYLKLYRKLVE